MQNVNRRGAKDDVGEAEQQERRDTGKDHLGVGTEGGLDDARSSFEHQAVGCVDEEGR